MSEKSDTQMIPPGENPAETMRKAMAELGKSEALTDLTTNPFTVAKLVTVPTGRAIHDVSDDVRHAAEFFKPARRWGTARLQSLESLLEWAERFKGSSSVLFANADMAAPTLTCIADYHEAGPATIAEDGDPTARHLGHRAVFDFPLSNEWKAWKAISGKPLDKDELGEFIEANAKDFMDPTPQILAGKISDKNADWENRMITTAKQIEGRFGQLTQLLAMSKRFQVFETSDLRVASNRDTGEAEIQFLNEHKTPEGKPLNVPNLVIIAIPVFLNGAHYRLPVRFRYRKSGASIKFILTIYNPEKAFEAAFEEAINSAQSDTDLPLFIGKPEH